MRIVSVRTLQHLIIGMAAFVRFALPPLCITPLDAQDANRESRIDEVKALISRFPEWPFVPLVANEKRTTEAKAKAREIESIAEKISRYDVAEIRQAISELAKDAERDGVSERLFFINQFLFAIPDRVAPGSPHNKYLNAGFAALPESAMTSHTWPWEQGNGRRLRFSVKAHGVSRMGEPYPALEVFDYYRKHFGLRPQPGSNEVRRELDSRGTE